MNTSSHRSQHAIIALHHGIAWLLQMNKKCSYAFQCAMHGGYSNSIVWPQSVFLCICSFLSTIYWQLYYCTCLPIAHIHLFLALDLNVNTLIPIYADGILDFSCDHSCCCCHRPISNAMVYAWNWRSKYTRFVFDLFLKIKERSIEWSKLMMKMCVTAFSWIIRTIWETTGGKSELTEKRESLGLRAYFCLYFLFFSYFINMNTSSTILTGFQCFGAITIFNIYYCCCCYYFISLLRKLKHTIITPYGSCDSMQCGAVRGKCKCLFLVKVEEFFCRIVNDSDADPISMIILVE